MRVLGNPPRNATLDLAIGIAGLWLAAGFMWDSWAHLHVGIESFFTPYHAVFYSAMLVGAAALGLAAVANGRKGYSGRHVLPAPYQRALLGVPIFFLGGLGDLMWHSVFGVEDRVEAVTSPTHLIIGLGVVVFLSGPIGSALENRAKLTTLWDQLPLVFSLATVLEFVHLGTSYAFDPAAAAAFAPPPALAQSADYFTATTLSLYKAGSGVIIVIFQSLVVAGFAIWLTTRFKMAFGAFALLFFLGEVMLAAALANDTPMLTIHACMALAAGLVADILVMRRNPQAANMRALRYFGMLVPATYFAIYFALTIGLQ
ncbi:MAG TPA: hypothetical protein VKG44_00935, partial [Candidatus Baltobacteraceae bacterium]|nr:hypothetical protein [Candidatus Baltobacteraceae bacterium]